MLKFSAKISNISDKEYEELINKITFDDFLSSKKEALYETDYNYFIYDSGLILQIKDRDIKINFSESRPYYNRENIIECFEEIIPYYLIDLELDLDLNNFCYLGVLFNPNKFNHNTSFIKFYSIFSQENNIIPKNSNQSNSSGNLFFDFDIKSIGLLPIKFDKDFYLTRIGEYNDNNTSLSSKSILEYRITLKNIIVSFIIFYLFNFF